MKIYSARHSHKPSIVILLPMLAALLFAQLTKAETWSIVSSGTANDIKGVTWDGSRFVAVDSEGGVLESTNGKSWSRKQTQSYGFSEIVAGGGHYIAIDEYDQTYYESSDRITWNERDTGQSDWLLGGTYNAGQFVLVGEYGTILRSSDGINWNEVTTSPTDTDLDRIIYGGGLYVSVGDAGIFTSVNTTTWTPRTRPIYGFSDVAFYGGRFVAVTFIYSQIFTSTTGTSWTGAEIESLNNTFPNLPPWGNAVCGGPSGFKIVCDSGKAFTSINGKDCQSIDMQTTSNINDVAYGGGTYVAVGNNGLIRVLLNTVPEIAVEQPVATNIADGGSKTFGSVAFGASASLTFTIKNIGTANLTGLTVTKDGTNPGDFTVTSNPVAPVAGPSGSTTFIVSFAPTAAGARSTAIHIASNDADENPFDISLTGTGVGLDDPDGDGLGSLAELNEFGTDPLLADSNSDGLSDTYAVCFVGTPIQPSAGNQISINLKKLAATGNTLKLVGKLPKGLTFNATTGLISGTITGTPGIYPISVQVLQGASILRTIPFPITVLAFPASLIGKFESILEDANSIPIGACKIAITKANLWTATLESAGAATRKSKGTFILSQGTPVAPITAVFPATSAMPAVTVSVSIDGSNSTITGSYNGGTLRGFRLASGAENPPATVSYSLVLDAGVQDGINVPAGLGWMKGNVNSLGVGTFKGVLGDGTASGITLHLSASGQAVLWTQPYKDKKSYLGGLITLGNLGQTSGGNPKLTDSVWWSKASDATTLSYPAGFPAMPLTVGTSKWIAPATATALGASLGWRNDRTAAVTIDGAGLSNQDPQSTAAALPTEFTLDDQFNLTISAPTISSVVAWSGKITGADGAFTGTLTLPTGFSNGLPSGSAPASGIFVQDDAWGSVTGCGLIKVPVSGTRGSFRTSAFIFDQ